MANVKMSKDNEKKVIKFVEQLKKQTKKEVKKNDKNLDNQSSK